MTKAIARTAVVAAFLLLAVTCGATPSLLPGPESYTLAADFGMGVPVTTRLLAMGAPIACASDVLFANPAFAAAQKGPSAGLRGAMTDFDAGPEVSSLLAHVTYPTRANETGFGAQLIKVETHDGGIGLPGMGTANLKLSEDAWVVDYGRRIMPKVLVGLSILGSERLEFSMAMGPVSLVHYVAKADYGAQAGAAYEWAPGDFVGVLYSFTQHTVNMSGQMVGPDAETSFHASRWAIGASRHLRPDLVAVAEWQRGELKNGSFDHSSASWHFGAEYMPAPQWALRAGLADGNFTTGVGYDNGRWRFDYAYLRNWNDSDVEQLLGGSSTHSLEAIYQW